jgi:hypothetical protein
MKIGFSGTRQGMTNEQVLQVHMLLGDLKSVGATEATHGMCIGADAQFHEMAHALKYFTIGWPGLTAFGQMKHRSTVEPDLVMPAKPFLIRNQDIVRESDVMIITPAQTTPQREGSGTWATIRYTRSAQKPLIILWPDGTSTVERVLGATTAEEYRTMIALQRHHV